MIVGDLNVQRISIFPLKADSEFTVLAVELQRFEPVTGWHAQILETPSCVNEQKLPQRRPNQIRRESPGFPGQPKLMSPRIPAAAAHKVSLTFTVK
jgi:hypothetical protein